MDAETPKGEYGWQTIIRQLQADNARLEKWADYCNCCAHAGIVPVSRDEFEARLNPTESAAIAAPKT